jgi:hypothetical protein
MQRVLSILVPSIEVKILAHFPGEISREILKMTTRVFRGIINVSLARFEVVEERWFSFVVADVDGASESEELLPQGEETCVISRPVFTRVSNSL